MSTAVTKEQVKLALKYIEARENGSSDEKDACYDDLRRACSNDAAFAKAMLKARDAMEDGKAKNSG